MDAWWVCEHCHSVNRPGVSACYSCRAPRATNQQYPGQSPGSPTSGPPYDVPPASPYGPGPQTSQGYAVAGMGRRVGAWILDGFLVGLLTLIPMILALVSGAVSLNQKALDQIQQIEPGTTSQPFASVTVPLLNVDTNMLVVAATIYIALHLAYFAGCWIGFGGTPAQRALQLRVADNASGANLSIDQALLRWALLEGIGTVTGAVFLIFLLNAAATTPLNQLVREDTASTMSIGSGSLGSITLVSNVVSWGSTLWMIILLISAGANSVHRGLHDRLVGSIVLGPAPAYPSWPGYGYYPQGAPYWPPQGGPIVSGPAGPWSSGPPQPTYPTAPGPEPYPTYPSSFGYPPPPGGAAAGGAPPDKPASL